MGAARLRPGRIGRTCDVRFPPLTVLLSLGASAAHAHPGHLVNLASHDHWVAGAAIGLAIALGLWGALKGSDQPQPDADDTEEAEA